MKRIFFFILLSLFAVNMVHAQQGRPSYLLLEQEGEIIIYNANSGETLNLTEDLEEPATWPHWSDDGQYISFVIVESDADLPQRRNEVPVGEIAWVDVQTMEISYVERCQRNDVQCTDPQISGDYLVFTAVRVSDGVAILYSFNMATSRSVVLQTDQFEVGNPANHWRERNQFQVVGSFSDRFARELKIFDVPGPGYEITEQWSLDYYPSVTGCNFETVISVGNSARSWLEISDSEYDVIAEFEYAEVARGEYPWRNCRALPIDGLE